MYIYIYILDVEGTPCQRDFWDVEGIFRCFFGEAPNR